MNENKKQIAVWVRELQNGDGTAFEKLYNATNDTAYFTALKIMRDPDEAQDILQDSYIVVLEKIQSLNDPEKFVSWLNQIVANRAKNALQKKHPVLFDPTSSESNVVDFIPDNNTHFQPEESFIQTEAKQIINEIVDNLSDDKRMCVILYYFNNMRIAEIAEIAGVNENAIKARLFQARKDIKKAIIELEKKNTSLRGIAPIPFFVWILRSTCKTEGQKFAVEGAGAVLDNITATAKTMSGAITSSSPAIQAVANTVGGVSSAGTAVAGTATLVGAAKTAAAAGGGIAAKVTALSVTQKVVIGIIGAGFISGTAAGTVSIVRHSEQVGAIPASSIVEESGSDYKYISEALDFSQTAYYSGIAEPETERQDVFREVTEPVGTTRPRPPETTTTRSTTTRPTTTTTRASTTAKRPTTTTTTRPPATQAITTTTRPTTVTTPSTTATTTAAPTTTTTTTTKPPTPKEATYTISYAMNNGKSGTITCKVPAGSAITWNMVDNEVRRQLSGVNIQDILNYSGSEIASAQEDGNYSFTVMVSVS